MYLSLDIGCMKDPLTNVGIMNFFWSFIVLLLGW